MKPMKDPLGVSTTRGKEKILLTSVGIEPTTSGLFQPSKESLNFSVLKFLNIKLELSTENSK